MYHDFTGNNLAKLYHGTNHVTQIMAEGLEPRPGLSNEGMLGEDIEEAIFLTPDPAEARKYGKHVIRVDARKLELGIVDGPQCWHYFSDEPIPVECLTLLDEQEFCNEEQEYIDFLES